MLGLRLALSWLTVLPVDSGPVNRDTARRAIGVAPLVGVLIGLAALAGLAGLGWLGAPPLLAGILVVALVALATRGMHLDGLADTVDGLGCYGPPERALEIMRQGAAGPFGVVALVLVLGAQSASLAALAGAGRWGAVVLAFTVGRLAFGWCCRHGVPAARPDGMGAFVAGSQPLAVPLAWTVVLAAAGVVAVPGAVWLGPLAVLLAGALVVGLNRHVRRRFGGITGDTLGGACELATTVVLAVCSLSP